MRDDDWGRDPAVRRTRELFGQMEQAQREVISRAGVSPFDLRLRAWREEALARFERSWRTSGEGDAISFYRACLAHVLEASGVAAAGSPLRRSEEHP